MIASSSQDILNACFPPDRSMTDYGWVCWVHVSLCRTPKLYLAICLYKLGALPSCLRNSVFAHVNTTYPYTMYDPKNALVSRNFRTAHSLK